MCCIVPKDAYIFVLSTEEVGKLGGKKSEAARKAAAHTTHPMPSNLPAS